MRQGARSASVHETRFSSGKEERENGRLFTSSSFNGLFTPLMLCSFYAAGYLVFLRRWVFVLLFLYFLSIFLYSRLPTEARSVSVHETRLRWTTLFFFFLSFNGLFTLLMISSSSFFFFFFSFSFLLRFTVRGRECISS